MNLTDAEQQFADSLEGRACVAKARYQHEARERHRGADARTFTDAMERQAIRDGLAKQARQAVAAEALKQSAYVRTLDTINATKVRDAARDARFRNA
jgi:hypothetical protein